MRIAITGANSAVGQAILQNRPAHNNETAIIAGVRSDRAAEEIRRLLHVSDTLARISYDKAESLSAVFQGADSVIHLAGILIESPGSNYEQANVVPVRSVVEAAKKTGIKKIVLVSAIGANESSSNGYWRTKGKAEELVRASGIPYTILRVPLLLGHGTEGAAALLRNARGPKAMLIGGGRNFQQPLDVRDVARAALIAAQLGVAKDRTLDLAGPLSLPESELVQRASRLLGREAKIRSIPKPMLRLVLSVKRFIGRPGFSLDALEVITSNTQIDPQPAAGELGIELTGIDEMIQSSLEP